MGYFEGLIGGFSARKAEIEQQNLAEAAASRDRESRVFSTLIASPDPEIQQLAVAGLLHSAEPGKRKKGLSGWLGEMEQSPYLGQIQSLMQKPVTKEEEYQSATLPSTQSSGYLSTPPGQQPAALPGTSSVNIGSPPPAQVQSGLQPGDAGPPTPPAAGGPPPSALRETVSEPTSMTRTRSVSLPRRVFATPGDVAAETAAGQYGGRVKGILQGMREAGVNVTPEVAQQVALELSGYSGSTSATQSIAGEVLDPATGKATPAFAILDRATGHYLDPNSRQPMQNFRPRQTGGTYHFGQTRESIAQATYGKGFGELNTTEQQDVMDREQKQIASSAQSRTEGVGAGRMTTPADFRTAQAAGVPVGTTPNAAVGQKVGSPAERDRKIGIENIRDQLGQIRSLLTVLPKQGELGELAPGAALSVKRRLPGTRTAVAALESAVSNIVNSLARSVGEQRGTQTELDAKRAYDTVVDLQTRLLDPLSGDTQESAAERLDQTMHYLETVLSRLPGAPTIGGGGGASAGVGTSPPAPPTPPAASVVGAPPPSFSAANFRPGRSAPAGVVAPPPGPAPDLSGLAPDGQRRFTKGPFAGQIWALDPAGQPQRVQ